MLPFLISSIMFITTEPRQALYAFVLCIGEPETPEKNVVPRELQTQFTAVPFTLPRTRSIHKPLLGLHVQVNTIACQETAVFISSSTHFLMTGLPSLAEAKEDVHFLV